MSVEKIYLIKKEVNQGKKHEVTIGTLTVEGKDPSTRINRAMIWCASRSKIIDNRYFGDEVLVYTLIGECTKGDHWKYKSFDNIY